jgi:hypothetical protein
LRTFAADEYVGDTVYVDLDMGALHSVTSVTVWHYYVDVRKYFRQTIEISETGAFSGEQVYLYNVPEGPVETAAGNTVIASPAIRGRYIRHRCGRNSVNTWINIIEIEVNGRPTGNVPTITPSSSPTSTVRAIHTCLISSVNIFLILTVNTILCDKLTKIFYYIFY